MFQDAEDKNNCLFGLAMAQWETKSLDLAVFNQVKEIIETGCDLELWKGLSADNKTLQKREKELEKFLVLISSEREKPKRRVRPKVDYSAVQLLTLQAPDGKKTFTILESYINGVYWRTSSKICWGGCGGSVFSFSEKGKFVTAHWLDSQTLEIRHDPTIVFSKKEESFYLLGDQGIVKYIAV